MLMHVLTVSSYVYNPFSHALKLLEPPRNYLKPHRDMHVESG
jgi:hypothetical protein